VKKYFSILPETARPILENKGFNKTFGDVFQSLKQSFSA